MIEPPLSLQENIRLAPFTTLQVGGAARYFAEADSEAAVHTAFAFAARERLPVFVLGGGSNVLVADEGFPGLVIRVALKGISFAAESEPALVTAGAGEDWDGLVAQCVARDLAGIECLSGIPGSVGGTPVQNVGAYGQEVSETIRNVRALDRRTEEIVELSNAACGFRYRASIFNTTERDRYVVLAVTYALRRHGAPTLRYADLQTFFAGHSAPPSLQEVRAAVLAIRARKGMVIDAHDPDTRSAGSFFKNPVLTKEAFARLADAVDEMPPSFPAGEQVKVPAAWLIERAGFAKGYAKGRAGISSKHTLALVNRGGATAREICDLAQEIQARVQERFGVALVPEPVFVGVVSQSPK